MTRWRRDQFGLHALQRVGVDGAQVAAHLVMGLAQHQQAAGAEHDVVVQVLAQRLVQAAGLFVDRGRGVLQVVRADDRGVAAGVAAAEPALFDDRDIGDAVVLAKVVGGGKAVAPGADDDRVIGGFRFRRGPGAFPAHVVAELPRGRWQRPNNASSGPLVGRDWAGLVRLSSSWIGCGFQPHPLRHNRENCDIDPSSRVLRRASAVVGGLRLNAPFLGGCETTMSGRNTGYGSAGKQWRAGAFWAVAAGLAALVAGVLVAAVRRGPARGGRGAPILPIYKDQLAEIERDLTRGTIGPDEADAAAGRGRPARAGG